APQASLRACGVNPRRLEDSPAGLGLRHLDGVLQAHMRQGGVDLMLGQLLDVIRVGQPMEDDALAVEFNGEIANAAAGAELHPVLQLQTETGRVKTHKLHPWLSPNLWAFAA